MGILDKVKGKKPAAAKKTANKKADKAEETTAVATQSEATRGPLAREGAGDSYRILLKPVMTEKSSMLATQTNQYTFAVAAKATKVDVARAIRDLYGVKPTKVRIVNIEGKVVRFGRSMGREKAIKKAIVTLKQGETLSL